MEAAVDTSLVAFTADAAFAPLASSRDVQRQLIQSEQWQPTGRQKSSNIISKLRFNTTTSPLADPCFGLMLRNTTETLHKGCGQLKM